MSKKASLADRLAKAAEGVMLPSEFDSPFTVVEFPGAKLPSDVRSFRHLVGIDGKVPVELFDAEAVLQRLARESASDDADVKKMKAKFRKLTAFLDDNFDELAGFRIGKINVETYILGATPDGVIGLNAGGVET
jgi:hypothetical protein